MTKDKKNRTSERKGSEPADRPTRGNSMKPKSDNTPPDNVTANATKGRAADGAPSHGRQRQSQSGRKLTSNDGGTGATSQKSADTVADKRSSAMASKSRGYVCMLFTNTSLTFNVDCHDVCVLSKSWNFYKHVLY